MTNLSRLGRRVVVCLALLLCGCTGLREYIHNGFKVGPNYSRPAAPIAERWIDADDVRLRSEEPDDSQWWTVFNDSVLNALVQNTYAQNLSLRAAGFRVLEARAQRAIAVGNLFPQSQQAYSDYNRNKISTQVNNQSFLRDTYFSIWDGGFSLSWELDFWGRFRRTIESATDLLDASVEQYDDALVTLLADTATAYVQMRTFQERIELARANVRLQSKTLSIAEARWKGGTSDKVDYDQALSDLSQLQATIPGFQIQARQQANQLCTLMGVPPYDIQNEMADGNIPAPPLEMAVGIPADLLRRRPDIRSAERQVAAQSAQIGVAEAEYYPTISLVGSIGLEANQFGDLFGPGASTGQFGPSLRWNILNYGRLLNNVRFQDAKFQELAATYMNTVLTANQEVENALIAFLRLQEQIRYLRTSVAAAEDAVLLETVKFEKGEVSFTRLSILQQDLVQQQDQEAQSRGALALAVIDIYRALGGGWQIRCAPSEGPVPIPEHPPAEVLPVAPQLVLPPE